MSEIVSVSNLFVVASREKYLFPTVRGNVTLNDLWDIPLNSKSGFSLNAIANSIHSEILKENSGGNIDFVNDKKATSSKNKIETLENKLELVKFVIGTLKTEAENSAKASEVSAQKQKIMEAIANKQNEAFNNLSKEDLEKMLSEIVLAEKK